jgi:RND family efflux transporter MFP subunit
MTKGLRSWVVAGVVLLVGSTVAWGLFVGKPAPQPEAAPMPRAPLVDVVAVDPRSTSLLVHTQGSVTPRREISLVSQVAGRVEAVAPQFARGGFVAAGETLVRLEDADYRFALARAESQVAAARQRVAEEKGRALQARREWRDLGSAEANALFLRKPQLAAAEAALRAAEADVGAARLDLERTSIAVPFNGRISDKQVDVGQFVAPGTVIARIYDTDVVEVRLPLTDRQVALLDLPLSADRSGAGAGPAPTVTLNARFADREWSWQGRIVRTDASIDVDSRVVYAVAEVEEPFRDVVGNGRPPLAPGLFVHAEIEGRRIEGVATVPRSALRSDDTVMIVDRESRIQARPVRVLQSHGQRVWLQGLDARDRVVVREDTLMVAGMAVAVNNVTQLAGGGQ